MNVKHAFIIVASLTSVLLTVYVCTQPSLTHLTLAIAKFSPRKQSVCYELPTQNNFNYQDGEGDSAIISTTSVIDNHTWQDALHQFQLAVEQVRDNFINEFMSQIGKCVSCNNKTTVFDEFLNVRLALKSLSKVNLLVGSVDVGWFGGNASNESVVANLPAKRMFKPFGTQPVCDDFPNKIWQQIISCNSSDINQHAATTSTAITNNENEVLRRSLLLNYSPESLYSYVNLFGNVSINDLGSIKAYNGCLTVLQFCSPRGVRRDKFLNNEKHKRVRIVDEVFTIAQYWGYGYFHATIENLPRLAPYVEFLQRRPHIRLHVALNSRINKRTSEHVTASLAALGIDPKRLVSGHIQAKIAYVPRGTPCGNGLMPELQILSWRFHNYIANSLNEMQHSSIVLIIRESSKNQRNMARSTYKLIKKHLRTVTKDGPLKLELFDDRHRLRHSDTLRLFYRARIVIGIHGAGLANMIYSRPGTQVIEMLCQPPDDVNLCYANTALILGHRYHAFPVNHCTDNPTIDIGKFLTVLDTYIGAETVQAGVHSR
jgi:hypothetical protein